MQNWFMKKIVLIISFYLAGIISVNAQQKPVESGSPGIIKELELSPQQRQAMRDTILIFRRAEMKSRAELRKKLLAILNTRQQMILRRRYHKPH